MHQSKAVMALAKCILVIVTLGSSITICGQPYFSKIYPGLPLVRASITPDSGLVVIGGGGATFNQYGAGRWLMRVDRSGFPMWSTAYNPLEQEAVRIHDVAWIGDSSFIIVGNAGTYYTTNNKMVQQVVGPTGQVLWGGKATGNGFEETDYWLNRAERAVDGSVIVCGARLVMNLAGIFGPGYAARVGPEVGSYFTPLVSYTSGPVFPVAIIKDVAATSEGGFISLGFGSGLMIAYKVDALGSVYWSRSLTFGGDDLLQMHVLEGEAGSTYIAHESFGGSFRLMQLGPDGNVLWCKRFQMLGEDKPTGLERLPNGELWISGMGWLMACSANGDVLWARSIPHLILDMEAAPEGDGVFLVGRDGSDGWIMRTDVNGHVPGCAEASFAPTVTPETLVSSSYSPPIPFNAMSSYTASVVPGEVPTAVLDCIPTAVQIELTDGAVMRTYPVPFSHQLNIDLPGTDLRLELIDALGRIRRSLQTTKETSIIMDKGDLHPGLYLLRVEKDHSHVAVQPVIVE